MVFFSGTKFKFKMRFLNAAGDVLLDTEVTDVSAMEPAALAGCESGADSDSECVSELDRSTCGFFKRVLAERYRAERPEELAAMVAPCPSADTK